jgi:membrane-bound metal-dependent hydrolase YbcI (DUF457 family)
MALGYLLGKASAEPYKQNVNVSILMVLSILPDIDILAGIPDFHRGPTHSLITATLVFIPIFIIYRHKALPYFLALLSHSFADLVIGGNLQLLWPLTTRTFFMPRPFPIIQITSPLNIAAETILFMMGLAILVLTGDYRHFFRRKLTNFTLLVPITTVLLPTFLAYPLEVPPILIPPHLFYLVLFTLSIVIFTSARPREGNVQLKKQQGNLRISSISLLVTLTLLGNRRLAIAKTRTRHTETVRPFAISRAYALRPTELPMSSEL